MSIAAGGTTLKPDDFVIPGNPKEEPAWMENTKQKAADFVGEVTWSAVWAGLLWVVILCVLTIWFARRQMRRLIP